MKTWNWLTSRLNTNSFRIDDWLYPSAASRGLSGFLCNVFGVALAGLLFTAVELGAQETIATEVVMLSSDSPAAEVEFGIGIALDGDTMVVGARGEAGGGAVYIYGRNEGGAENWGLVKRLVSEDAAEGDRFGGAVALSEDLLAVGATGDDDINPSVAPGTTKLDASGSVYLFERDSGGPNEWGQVAKLVASNGEIFENFGFSVSLSGNLLAVGSWTEEVVVGSGETQTQRIGVDSGSSYVFERNPDTGAWTEQVFIDSPRGPLNTTGVLSDNYARRVAISGENFVVGASEEDANDGDQGSAYVYSRNEGGPNQWGLVITLRASDGARFDRFGRSIAIDGDTIVVGATGDDDRGAGSGTAFVFERSDGQWMETAKLSAGDGTGFEKFGEAVAIDGNTIVVGAPDEDERGSKAGALYVFQRGETGQWQQAAKITSSDGVADDRFGLVVDVEGLSAIGAAPKRDGAGEDSGVAFLYRLGGEPVGGYKDIFIGGPDLGGGWHFSEWFGFYNVNFFEPWIFHLEHVWMFVTAESTLESMFLYDLSSEGWFFTDSTQYPNMFSFARSAWVFYFKETAGPRSFVDLGTGEFFDLE